MRQAKLWLEEGTITKEDYTVMFGDANDLLNENRKVAATSAFALIMRTHLAGAPGDLRVQHIHDGDRLGVVR